MRHMSPVLSASLCLLAFGCSLALPLSAQTLDNASLSGPYGFVQLLAEQGANGTTANAHNLGGVMTFDGAGGFSFQAQLGSGSSAPQQVSGSGQYSVDASGFVTLTNPIFTNLVLNARLGAGAGVVLGSTTDGGASYDAFIAVRQPTGADSSLLSGTYTGSAFSLPNGSAAAATTALVSLVTDGSGAFSTVGVDGHAADQNDTPLNQNVNGATYQINADGTGALALGGGASLFNGNKSLFVSEGGEIVLGVSSDAGGRDLFVAVRNASGVNDASLSGNFWIVDLFRNSEQFGGGHTAAVGALRSNGQGIVSLAQKQNFEGVLDFSGINFYGLSSDGTGFLGLSPTPGVTNFAVGAANTAVALSPEGSAQGAPPNAFVGAQVFQQAVTFDTHGLTFGIRLPSTSGSGAFLSPVGALNAASFAPATNPIAPGMLMTLFGTGLAADTAGAITVPLPTNLSGVSATVNGTPAPLFFVSANQVNLQTPFDASGSEATIVLNNNGTVSNTITAPLAPTSPGVFSVQQTGFGPAIVTDANFQLITEQNSAAPGQVVIVFLTGLGAVNPPFADGSPGPGGPLSRVVDQNLQVLFDGEAGSISFAGAAPGFVGLYQINVAVPTTTFTGPAVPLQIVTTNAFVDFVDVAIGL